MLGTPSNSHAAVVKKVEKVAKIDQYLQHLSFKEKAEYAATNQMPVQEIDLYYYKQ